MEIDTFQYPSDPKRIANHRDANRIGKIRYSKFCDTHVGDETITNILQCPDCGRYITDYPSLKCHESEEQLEDRYGIYGPNCVIYLGFIKRIAIFMLICTILFGVPLLVINLAGYACQIKNYCISNDAIYNWSIYNVLGLQPGVLPHAIIWFLFCILMMAFTVYLRKYTLETYRRINDKNITDSDYCLLLRRLPELTQEKQIRELIQKQITRLNQDPERTRKLRSFSIRDIIMIKQHDQSVKSLRKQVKYFKKAAKSKQSKNFVPTTLPKPTQFSTAAIVRFHDMETNKQIARSAESPLMQKLLNLICAFYNPKTQHQINQKNISLSNAPHPTDMLWHNFGFSERSRIFRKIILTLSAIGVLILSGIIALIFSYWMELVTQSKGERPVYLTILIVLIVLIFNRIIRKIVVYTTKMERFETKTDKKSEQISLIAIHESVNLGFFSIIVPILVQLPQYIANQTTKSSSFPIVMFTTIIIQAIVTNILDFLIHLFDFKQKIRIWLDNKKISVKTHTEALRQFIGIQVPFVKCYAFNVKMVWFGFLYGVVSPIAIFIAFIGMVLTYYFQRILFNQKYSIPFYAGPRMNYQMIGLLDWTPLIIGLFNLLLYQYSAHERHFEQDSRVMGLIITMIVLGCIHILMPWKLILKKLVGFPKNKMDQVYNPNNMEITFQQSDPFGRSTPFVLYREPREFKEKFPETEKNLTPPPLSSRTEDFIKNESNKRF